MDEKFKRDFELFANQQDSDLRAIRVIFQMFLVSTFARHPKGTDFLNDLRSNVLDALSPPSPAESSDDARKRELTKSLTQQFFDELRGEFPGLKTTSNTSN